MADGEGFEPPVELPPQRFSRPSQSTALPPILNCFYAGLSTCGFVRLAHLTVLLTTRSRVAVLTLATLTRMQDRRNRPRLPPILNCFYAGLSTCGFVRLAHLTVLITTRSRVAGLYFTLFFTKRNRKNYHANKKQYPRQQLTHGQSPTG